VPRQRGEVPSECERVRGPWPQQVLWCDAFDDEVVELSIFSFWLLRSLLGMKDDWKSRPSVRYLVRYGRLGPNEESERARPSVAKCLW
jgi:hypothetical protein